MLDDLVAFVDALDLDPIVLAGQSMGGINALLYAATAPERVERLVLGDIGPEIACEGLQRIQGNVAARDTFTSLDDAFAHQQALNPRATDWALRQRIEHNLRELPDDTLTSSWRRSR